MKRKKLLKWKNDAMDMMNNGNRATDDKGPLSFLNHKNKGSCICDIRCVLFNFTDVQLNKI